MPGPLPATLPTAAGRHADLRPRGNTLADAG